MLTTITPDATMPCHIPSAIAASVVRCLFRLLTSMIFIGVHVVRKGYFLSILGLLFLYDKLFPGSMSRCRLLETTLLCLGCEHHKIHVLMEKHCVYSLL